MSHFDFEIADAFDAVGMGSASICAIPILTETLKRQLDVIDEVMAF